MKKLTTGNGCRPALSLHVMETPFPERGSELWLGKPAPRYTSYPPAPFFTSDVGANAYANALRQTAPDAPVSLYVHIPFCNSLCLYCGCNTIITNRAERINPYLSALAQEMAHVGGLLGTRRVSHLHFGGGTPNALTDNQMRTIFEGIRTHFDLSSVGEIAMELDPRHVTPEQARTLVACGVSRVSLGAQDFNLEVQRTINRVQPYELVAQVCDWLREAGLTRINLDLMYGLPKQTPETIADTARRVSALAPDRVALFSYAHVPSLKKHQKALEAQGLPDLTTRLAMEQTARQILTESGYAEIGIDHFAKPSDPLAKAWKNGQWHRNFQGYTEDSAETLIGLGVSAISQTPDGYFQGEHETGPYLEAVTANRLPIRRGYLLTAEDRLRRAIIEALMCVLACDLDALCAAHGFDVETLAEDLARLRPYEEAGLVTREGFVIRLATERRMAVRAVCKEFDPHSRGSNLLSSRTA